jgi:hypothetical protein
MPAARHAILAALAGLAWPALAAADPAQVLEQFGFFGRWSQHCERAPAPDNVLRTSWVAAGIARFREQIGKDRGESLYVVLDAARVGDDRVSIRVKLNGAITEFLVMVRDNGRMRTMFNHMAAPDAAANQATTQPEAGRTLVKDGIVTANNAATPWLSRCE